MTLALLSLLACREDPEETGIPTTDTGTAAVPVPVCDQGGMMCTAAGTAGLWGFQDGPAESAIFYLPTSVVLTDAGVQIADWNNHRIRNLSDGAMTTLAGNGFHLVALAGPALLSPFENPIDTAVCPGDSGFYVAELHAHRIDYVSADGVLSYVAGVGGTPGYEGDGGPALEALLFEPTGIACGPDGELYVSDSVNNVIRIITPDGLIDTFAGTGEMGFLDGPAEEAVFFKPQHLVVHDDALYVADWLNSAIRRISLDDRTVSTVVGTGIPGFSGDGGPALQAQLNYPYGVDFGSDGSMYVADTDNHVIRKVDPDGIISTVAGTPCGPEVDPDTGRPVAHPGYVGDGGAAVDGQLNWPNDVAIDADGKLWIADTMNSVIRTVQLPLE
jgi:hypothetical protein